ncbi:MAG: tetratricopeptide repeat protein, partial [bacterium]
HSAQGHYREAEALYRQTLGLRKRVLGSEHPDTLRSMYAFSHAFSVQGRHKEAEALLRETLEIQKRVLGSGHPETLRSLYAMACGAALQGARPEALRYLREGVDHGYSDVKSLLEDSDLVSLRGDPGFEKILATARVNQERAARTK